MSDNKNSVMVTFTEEQAERLCNLLLTHCENARAVIKQFNDEVVTEALEEVCRENMEIFDVIMAQRLKCDGQTEAFPVYERQEGNSEDKETALAYCAATIMRSVEQAQKNMKKSCSFTPTRAMIHGVTYDCENELMGLFAEMEYTFLKTHTGIVLYWK